MFLAAAWKHDGCSKRQKCSRARGSANAEAPRGRRISPSLDIQAQNFPCFLQNALWLGFQGTIRNDFEVNTRSWHTESGARRRRGLHLVTFDMRTETVLSPSTLVSASRPPSRVPEAFLLGLVSIWDWADLGFLTGNRKESFCPFGPAELSDLCFSC